MGFGTTIAVFLSISEYLFSALKFLSCYLPYMVLFWGYCQFPYMRKARLNPFFIPQKNSLPFPSNLYTT